VLKAIGERVIAISIVLRRASIKPSFDKLLAIERGLTTTLIERDKAIRASFVAPLAQQRLAVLGPPGTAKST